MFISADEVRFMLQKYSQVSREVTHVHMPPPQGAHTYETSFGRAASTSLLSMPLQNINSHEPFPHHSQTSTGVDGAHNEEHAEGEHALNVAQAAGDDAGGLRAGLEEVRT